VLRLISNLSPGEQIFTPARSSKILAPAKYYEVPLY
jgi:hypothetical protein